MDLQESSQVTKATLQKIGCELAWDERPIFITCFEGISNLCIRRKYGICRLQQSLDAEQYFGYLQSISTKL